MSRSPTGQLGFVYDASFFCCALRCSAPTYGTIKKIADGLGFEIKLTQDGKPDITKLEDIAADTEDDSARFIIIEHVINSMGYSLEIVPPEK